jgi:hypothetical protein
VTKVAEVGRSPRRSVGSEKVAEAGKNFKTLLAHPI